jgi:hypothetical protein
VTAKYRPHLAAIAALYVEGGFNQAAAVARVQETLGLPLKAATLKRWLSLPEFKALLRSAEEAHAGEQMASPYVRIPKRLRWLCRVEELYREQYDAATSKTVRLALLPIVHKLGDAIRDDERALEELRTKRARRSFRRFLAALAKLARAERAPLPVLEFLRAQAKRIDPLMNGLVDVHCDDDARTG